MSRIPTVVPRDTMCSIMISNESPHTEPIIFNPDFFVEKLRHEKPEVFLELVVSNITRLIDLPGTEFAQLIGEEQPKLPNSSSSSFFRSFHFLRRRGKGVVFGAPLTEEGIAQIYQLIEYLHKNLHVEGLFRIPGNSVRQQSLREALNSGMEMDLECGEFHPNDVATMLKAFLGELPEPLLSHRHYNAHLKIADLMVFDALGNKTSVADKERQIEALQLLFLLLPSATRNLLKLLLDLLYHTAKQQLSNKMSAHNLALMFAPHILWPRNLLVSDLQENITRLTNGVTFMIKHSQKLFRAPAYIRELARVQFAGSQTAVSKDDLALLPIDTCSELQLKCPKRHCLASAVRPEEEAQQHTEEALKQLFKHISNMPDSAKKKKLVRQFNKQPISTSQEPTPPRARKHGRHPSFGGLIKRKVLGDQHIIERKSKNLSPDLAPSSTSAVTDKENQEQLQKNLASPVRWRSGIRPQSTEQTLDNREEFLRGSKILSAATPESSI
ncbi:rho GTPase-activating protein 19 isoform X2 [Callorhinchus milii]|nr:rho GTPase-activating protein 19 isoform X2 [Callorhinchus milii]